jgi:hypothetical protein
MGLKLFNPVCRKIDHKDLVDEVAGEMAGNSYGKEGQKIYRTHLTSFAGVLGFEVSRYFAINNRACLTRQSLGLHNDLLYPNS